MAKIKVLFVCVHNSARSQMVHGFLQSFDNNITVCPAGSNPSQKLKKKAVVVMKEVGFRRPFKCNRN